MIADVLNYKSEIPKISEVKIGIFDLTNKKLKRKSIRSDVTTDEYSTRILVTDWNIHIVDSYKVDKKDWIKNILAYIRSNYNNVVLNNRTDKSMINEWVAHNNLYKLNIFRSHTKDVDLDYPQKWYMSVIYWLLSRIVL